MVSVFVSEHQFAQLKARYAAWKTAGFPDIDSALLIEIVERFNSFPGVVPLSCCVGHHNVSVKTKTPFHLYLAVHSPEGLALVQQVFERLGRRLVEVLAIFNEEARRSRNSTSHALIRPTEFQLSASFREFELGSGEAFTYCRWALLAKGTHNQPIRDNFMKAFAVVLEQIEPIPEGLDETLR